METPPNVRKKGPESFIFVKIRTLSQRYGRECKRGSHTTFIMLNRAGIFVGTMMLIIKSLIKFVYKKKV